MMLLALAVACASFGNTEHIRDIRPRTYTPIVQPEIDPSKQTLFDPEHGPSYRDVAQGSLGDCGLVAAMASMAYANPSHLLSIFNDPHDSKGTVTVNLWAQDQKYEYTVRKWTITDANPTSTDASIFVTGGQWYYVITCLNSLYQNQMLTIHRVWPNTLQLSMLQHATSHPESNIPADLYGVQPRDAFHAMSGPGPATTYLEISNTIDDVLWVAWKQVKTRPSVSSTVSSTSRNLDNGLPENHAYSALDYNDTKGTVTLRNPWGIVSQDPFWGTSTSGGEGVTDLGDGIFEITFTDWKTHFVDITLIDPC